MWKGGLPHLSGLPHHAGVPHLHVNRPLVGTKLSNHVQTELDSHMISLGIFNFGKCIYARFIQSLEILKKS